MFMVQKMPITFPVSVFKGLNAIQLSPNCMLLANVGLLLMAKGVGNHPAQRDIVKTFIDHVIAYLLMLAN